MAITRIPKKMVTSYLLGSLGYSGSDRWRDFNLLKQGFRCYQTAVGSGMAHIPLFVVLDLRLMAEFGNAFTFSEQKVEGFDTLVRAMYENQVLNRLLREFCVQQALELLSFFKFKATEAQEEAASNNAKPPKDTLFAPRADRLTQILLQRIAPHWPRTHVVNAAHLRGLSLDVPTDAQVIEAAATWDDSLKDRDQRMARQIERFVHSATGAEAGRRAVVWSEAIRPGDRFELEHLNALNREYLRVKVRHLIDVRESMPVLDPRDLDLKEEVSDVESLFMDQSRYPTGGFSEVTTRGSFENMVLSELIYMGRGAEIEDIPTDPKQRAMDLFDLRFVENELLYYLRDSGQLQRKRRTLHLAIDMREPLNIKYPEHPYQLETLVMGMVLALERDLGVLFANDAVNYNILLVARIEDATDAFPEHVTKLKEVLDILFAAPIQRDLLSVAITDAVPWETLASYKRKSYLVGFTHSPETVAQWSHQLVARRHDTPPLFGLTINLAEGEAPVEVKDATIVHLDLANTSLDRLKHTILEAVMRSGGNRGWTPPSAKHTGDDDDPAQAPPPKTGRSSKRKKTTRSKASPRTS